MARKRKKPTPPETAPVAKAPITSRYRFFLWICTFFAVAGLFIGLDVMTAWPGAEGRMLDLALSPERGSYLPAFVYGLLTESGAKLFEKADLFFLFPRIISALVMLATALLYYRWGSLLFGKRVVELQLLVAAASLYLPFFGKMATADSWLLLSHVGCWLSLIFLVRSGRMKQQFYLGIFALLGGIVAPFSTAYFIVIIFVVLSLRYSWQRTLKLAWPALVLPVIALLFHGVHKELVYFNDGLLSNNHLYALLGVLPFVGFAVAGVRDLGFKLRKREELAVILAALLCGGLFGGGPAFAFGLCLIAGKQLQLYFGPNYPWNNWVRGPTILHLIFALIGCFLLLLGGFITFRGDGYRAFLGMIAAYWIFSLMGVIGVYGMRRDFTVGGVVLSGLLATLFFWVQVYPYFETDRNWPQEMISAADRDTEVDLQSSKVYVGEQSELTSALPYFRRAGITTTSNANEADYELVMYPADTVKRPIMYPIEGRTFLRLQRFGLEAR